MCYTKMVLFLIISFTCSLLFAQDEGLSNWTEEEIHNANCRIVITQHRKSGLLDTDYVFLKAANKADCKKKADIYKINFAAQYIKKVEVEFHWLSTLR